jgi:flagellin
MPSINFNIPSLHTQVALQRHNDALATAITRLSTGNRVNHAKDDPVGNYEIEVRNSLIRKNTKAEQNAQDANSLLNVADGSLDTISNIVQRLRELAVQASNDTLDDNNRTYIQAEADNLLAEIDRISLSTNFNGKNLLSGKGPDAFSEEGRPARLQVGTGNERIDDYMEVKLPVVSVDALGLSSVSFLTGPNASKSIDSLDDALETMLTSRSNIGALMNRMDVRTDNLQLSNQENSDYIAQIGDTDFAEEATAFTTAQLLQQSALSIMAQANSRVSDVLKILGG